MKGPWHIAEIPKRAKEHAEMAALLRDLLDAMADPGDDSGEDEGGNVWTLKTQKDIRTARRLLARMREQGVQP